MTSTDTYPWGEELIVWGNLPEQANTFTFKILKPKKGRAGCLSLQYHKEKSESWYIISGVAVAIYEGDTGEMIKKVLKPGDHLNLPTGKIHRLISASNTLQVAEASTPDVYARDKTIIKDVIRLHCVHGRDCPEYKFLDEFKKEKVDIAIRLTEETLREIEDGRGIMEKKVPTYYVGV